MAQIPLPSAVHAQAFNRNVNILLQSGSQARTRIGLRTDGDARGDRMYFDAYGQIEMGVRTSAKQATIETDTPRQRTAVDLVSYEISDAVAVQDQMRTVHEMANPLTRVAVNAANRKFDAQALAAIIGTAMRGDSGGTGVALPASQQDNSVDTAMTWKRLAAAAGRLADVGALYSDDEMSRVYFAITPQIQSQLLADADFASRDYTSRSLRESDNLHGVSTHGVTFLLVNSDIVPKHSGGNHYGVMWCKGGVGMFMGGDVRSQFYLRADRGNNPHIQVNLDVGFGRIDDNAVYRVRCSQNFAS